MDGPHRAAAIKECVTYVRSFLDERRINTKQDAQQFRAISNFIKGNFDVHPEHPKDTPPGFYLVFWQAEKDAQQTPSKLLYDSGVDAMMPVFKEDLAKKAIKDKDGDF